MSAVAKSLPASAVVQLKLSCQNHGGLELRCGFFGADLELLERAPGRPWVVAAELGQRVEVRALAETKADASGCVDAFLRIHLSEVLSAASFLVLAAIVKHADALQHPLLLEIADEGMVVHQVRRQEASGGPGTLLAVISRGRTSTDLVSDWHLHDILPNNAAICGDREHTIIRELYWPEVGVAIQRSSPAVSNPSVIWLEVFQAAAEGSIASSDEEDIGSISLGSSSDSMSVDKSSHSRRGNSSPQKSVSRSRTSASDSDAPCGYGEDLPLPLHGQGRDTAPLPEASSKSATIVEISSPEFTWPSDAKTPKPNAHSAIPRFGNSPSPLSGNTNTSPSLLVDTSVDSVPILMLGSPNGPPSLATSPLGTMLAQAVALSPEQHMLQSMVVEQPHAVAPANVLHHKASSDTLCSRLQQLQEENVAIRVKCESREKELAAAARQEARVLETESWALEQLSHERALGQQLRNTHSEEFRVMNARRSELEDELCRAVEQVRETELRDEALEEQTQHSVLRLQEEHLEALRRQESQESERTELSSEDMERLKHEIEDLRFSSDLQKNQLSQSQSLAAELRAEARHLCEERDKNLAEAYAERVRASQLQEQLAKEQAKFAEAQSCNGDSTSSGAIISKLMNSEDRRACSLLTLQQRLQEATLDADRERGNTAEWRRIAEQCREENVALLRKLQEDPHETDKLSTREDRHELSQAQALILQLRHELKAERARSHSLEDSLSNEASQMAQCLLVAKHGAVDDATSWSRELKSLRVELRETECEFHEELASVRGRLVNADQRNRKLCESLRAAMQVGHPATNGKDSHGSTAPESQNLPAPSFANGSRFEEPPRSPCVQHLTRTVAMTPGSAAHDMERAGLAFAQAMGTPGGEFASSVVPRASSKPPRSLQGDYSRFVDWNQRSSTDLGACQISVRSASVTSSPKGEHTSRPLRPSHSQTSLPSRNALMTSNLDQPAFLLTDVSEGAPELGFGPGGPGASRHASLTQSTLLQSQNTMYTGLTREYLTRGWR